MLRLQFNTEATVVSIVRIPDGMKTKHTRLLQGIILTDFISI